MKIPQCSIDYMEGMNCRCFRGTFSYLFSFFEFALFMSLQSISWIYGFVRILFLVVFCDIIWVLP